MPNINVVLWHTHRMTEKIKVYDQFYRLIPLILAIHIQLYMIAGKNSFLRLTRRNHATSIQYSHYFCPWIQTIKNTTIHFQRSIYDPHVYKKRNCCYLRYI